MFRLRRREALADWLPWLLPLNAQRETVMTAAGGLLRVARIDPPDFETASAEELVAHHARVAAAVARYGNGWSFWFDQWRVAAPGYFRPDPFGGCVAAQLIDESRRRQFLDTARPVFANSAFVAVHYLPQNREAFAAWLMDRADSQVAANVAFFLENSDALFQELSHSMRGVTVLRGDELSSYLSATVTYDPRHVSFPTGALAPQFASREWRTTPSLTIDGVHLATVEVCNFGSPSPLTVEALHELPFPCRWTTTLHGLGPDERRKEIVEVRKRWLTKQKGIGALLTEIVTRNPFSSRTDPEADRALAQLDVMQGELADRPYALAHSNVHVWADSFDEAQERAARVASLLKASGLEARVASLNSIFAPLADMPGNVTEEVSNVRRARVEIAALTRTAPITGVSLGHREDWRFNGPALMVGTTRKGTPFWWSLNALGSDSAHTALIGSTGSGKSAFIGFMAAQFLRYAGAKVIVFDRRRSFMVGCLAMGGDWIELGGSGVGVQPLRAIDRPEEMAWAHDWLVKALRVRGAEVKPHTEAALTDALQRVADLAPDQRTLTRLAAYLAGDAAAGKALQVYLSSGPYGQLFDGVVAGYGSAEVMGIETNDIMQLEGAAPLAISAMFRAVQRDRLTGDSPKLVVIDEAWSLLGNDLFGREIESWAREMRKLKAALVLATQSLADLSNGRMQVIFDQMGNRIFLPMAEALRPQTRALYEAAGLQEEQIRALALAEPKAEYLIQTGDVTRLVKFRLSDDALRLCASSGPADHARANALLAQGVRPGTEFTKAWLAQTTAEWLAGQGVPSVAA